MVNVVHLWRWTPDLIRTQTRSPFKDYYLIDPYIHLEVVRHLLHAPDI